MSKEYGAVRSVATDFRNHRRRRHGPEDVTGNCEAGFVLVAVVGLLGALAFSVFFSARPVID
jgi:hypothetical protein